MTPRPNEIYRHFKGNLYKIITIAKHSETEESMVVYQALYGDFPVYVRPLDMFVSKVDREKYPDVKQELRFEKVKAILDAVSEASFSVNEETNTVAPFSVDEDMNLEASFSTDEEMNSVVPSRADEDLELDDDAAVDPLVMEFLEAETIAERKNILQALHHRITEDMIYTLALALDVVIDEGDLEDRYRQLMVCLNTIEKYEIER